MAGIIKFTHPTPSSQSTSQKASMDHTVHNKIVNFIWAIADDCLRDVYVRGKYRDVILPMFVLRRLDCLLKSTKEAVKAEVPPRQQLTTIHIPGVEIFPEKLLISR